MFPVHKTVSTRPSYVYIFSFDTLSPRHHSRTIASGLPAAGLSQLLPSLGSMKHLYNSFLPFLFEYNFLRLTFSCPEPTDRGEKKKVCEQWCVVVVLIQMPPTVVRGMESTLMLLLSAI